MCSYCNIWGVDKYRQVSNIRRTKSQHLKDYRTVLRLPLAESLEARCQVENEDVVGAAPVRAAPTWVIDNVIAY